MEHLILMRENNVDGCGGHAEMLVFAQREVTYDDVQALQASLNAIKSDNNDNCYDTEAMITYACNKVFGFSNWIFATATQVEF